MPAAATQVNLRCTYEEEAALVAAAAALDLAVSYLVEAGGIQAALDLGGRLLDDAPPRLKPGFAWPWEPRRIEGESAKARITAYVGPTAAETVASAAWAVRLSTPLFLIGATLRLVAQLKLVNERRQKLEPGKYNEALAAVRLPYGFDELARTAK